MSVEMRCDLGQVTKCSVSVIREEGGRIIWQEQCRSHDPRRSLSAVSLRRRRGIAPFKPKVRLAVKETGEEQTVWEALQERLEIYLTGQGVANVAIEKAPEPPQLHPKSGKFQQVWSEVKQRVSEVEAEPLKVVP